MPDYNVVACRDCGFVFADNIPSQADFNDYYASMSKYEFNYNKGMVTKEYIDYYTNILEFVIPHLPDDNARILDIGCATGALLSMFQSRGYHNLVGIDPSSACVRTARQSYALEATVNDISNFDTREKFDLVLLSSVLEHLVDFKSTTEKFRALLKDHGLLFIEVPDAERFELYISAPFQQFSVEHVNYFSQYSLGNFLSMFSFEVIEMQKNVNKVALTVNPDIFVLARKTDRNDFKIIRDKVSESKVRDYILRCSETDTEIRKIIEKKLAGRNKIIIWGVGTHTQRLLGAGLDSSKILFFVDSNTRYVGKKIMGLDIKSPGDIRQEDIPILISTHGYQEEISHQIKNVLRLKNEIITIY